MNTPIPKNLKAWALAFATAAVLLDPQNASAQSRVWVGTTGAWETPANWSGTTVPSGSDQAGVRNGGTATITTAVPAVNRIYIGGATLSQLQINSGGSLEVTGDNLIRISQTAGDKGAITVNGGSLQGNGLLYVGVASNTQATLTVQNNGNVTPVDNYITLATSANVGVTATLNIGGETAVAAGAGWVNTAKVIGGVSAGAAHTNVLNFNHTSNRYTFTRTALSSTAVVIAGAVEVNVKAGVTVLTGSNNYTQGTTISNNAVLLANFDESSITTHSSTGIGSVEVQEGGTLGGIGYVGGNTTVSGILKPGDYDYEAASPAFATLKFRGNLTLEDESSTIIGINGDFRGTSFSAINVAGTITLDGELRIELWDDFTIANGETKTFQIFSGYQSITGGYEVYTLPETWNDLNLVWNTNALSTGGYVSVEAIPEPFSGALFLGGSLLIYGIVARRRNAASKRA